ALEANDYAVLDGTQELTAPLNFSPMTYGAAGLIPPDKEWDKPYSPLFKYSWKTIYPALLEAEKVNTPNPFDGIIMQYSNPLTGEHVMQTMGASIQLLPKGFKGKAHKHTGSFVYQCAKGKGYSIIDGKRYDWKERDIFCVPSWAWHEHHNLSDTEDACLFSFNDLPVIESLGLYQEKEYTENRGNQKVVESLVLMKKVYFAGLIFMPFNFVSVFNLKKESKEELFWKSFVKNEKLIYENVDGGTNV